MQRKKTDPYSKLPNSFSMLEMMGSRIRTITLQDIVEFTERSQTPSTLVQTKPSASMSSVTSYPAPRPLPRAQLKPALVTSGAATQPLFIEPMDKREKAEINKKRTVSTLTDNCVFKVPHSSKTKPKKMKHVFEDEKKLDADAKILMGLKK